MREDFPQTLRQILEPGQPFAHRLLPALSNLVPEDLQVLRRAWPVAPDERRRQIARALLQLNEDNPDLYFREAFLLLLDDPDEDVRAAAIDGLGDDQSGDLLERLLALVAREPVPAVRSQALLALGQFLYHIETTDFLGSYRERLLRVLLEIHDDPQSPLEARRRALESAAYACASAPVEEAIARAYADPERAMRASAVHAMGHHMGERWRPTVERELASPDPEMRYEAAHACGEFADPELVPLLAPLVNDDDREVKLQAIWALGEIGGVAARRLLRRCLDQADDDIVAAVREALQTLDFYEDPTRVAL